MFDLVQHFEACFVNTFLLQDLEVWVCFGWCSLFDDDNDFPMHRSRIPKASGGLHRENPNGGRSEAAVPCLSEDHAREEQSHDGQPCRGNSHSSYRRLQLLQQDFQSQELSEESPQKMRTCQLITLLFNSSWKWTLWRPLLSDSMHLGKLSKTF